MLVTAYSEAVAAIVARECCPQEVCQFLSKSYRKSNTLHVPDRDLFLTQIDFKRRHFSKLKTNQSKTNFYKQKSQMIFEAESFKNGTPSARTGRLQAAQRSHRPPFATYAYPDRFLQEYCPIHSSTLKQGGLRH